MATITDDQPTTESSAAGVETGDVVMVSRSDEVPEGWEVIVAAMAWADHPTPANIGALHAAVARYRGLDTAE